MSEKQTVKFGDICREVKLTTKDPIGDGYERYIGLEHLDSGSLKIKRWGMIAEDNPSFTRVFKKGHILFGKRRPYLKKAAIAEFDGICSGDIIVMEPKLLNSELFPYIVQSDSFWDWAIQTSSGSLSPRTKYKSLAQYQFMLPDETNQEKILTVLRKIEKNESELELTMEHCFQLKKSLESKFINHLVSYSLSDEPGFYKLSELGDFKNGLNKDKDSFGSGTPFVNLDDVFAKDEIDTTPEGLVECSKSDIENYSLNAGDILFVRSSVKPSGVAKTSLILSPPGDVVFSGFLIRFRPKDIRLSEFFNFIFNSEAFKHRISAFVTVSANSNINQKALQAQKIKIPPHPDVETICTSLRAINGELRFIENQLATLKKVQKSIIEG